MRYLDRLPYVASMDIECLKEKEKTYKGSWKKRGGIGAFMMLARKWDRLEEICTRKGFDIFDAIGDGMLDHDGTALAEIRDLRRYLLLVEAEMMGRVHKDGTPKEDSNRHAATIMDSDEWMDEPEVPARHRLPQAHRN